MTETGTNWKIVLYERPTSRGKSVLPKLFGRAAGHIFLGLTDGTKIHTEMHAIVMSLHNDPDASIKSYKKVDVRGSGRIPWVRRLEYIETFSMLFGIRPIVNFIVRHTGMRHRRSTIRVCVLKKEAAPNKNAGETTFDERTVNPYEIVSETTIDEGSEQHVRRAWQKMRSVSNTFNLKNVPYCQLSPAGEFNCQATLRWVLNQCGYDTTKVSFQLWNPGWDPTETISDMVRSVNWTAVPKLAMKSLLKI
ncbi:MAG TPA: hypothetical protein VIN59_09030 [Alphaproteobacteria bacterium]